MPDSGRAGRRIVVIGGGPAGLFAAVRLAALIAGPAPAGPAPTASPAPTANPAPTASPVPEILLLERKARPGRKLLLSGSGQCNLTHDGPVDDFPARYGGGDSPVAAARFIRPALLEFSNTVLLEWFEARGLGFEVEEGGKVFPATRKASSVLDVLLAEAGRLGVVIESGSRVRTLERRGSAFAVGVEREPGGGAGEYEPGGGAGEREPGGRVGRERDGGAGSRRDDSASALAEIPADIVLVATGGASFPATGSTGDGYALAAGLGLPTVQPRPALSAVIVEGFSLGELAGLSFRDAGLVVRREGKKTASRTGDVLITHRGLSGPLILDSSRGIRPGDILELRFADAGLEDFRRHFDQKLADAPRRLARTILAECGLPRSLAEVFCRIAGVGPDLNAAGLTRGLREALCVLACACPFKVASLGGLNEAMVSAGGVALSSINPKTMESRLVPGLFFAGEVLDLDGDSGGYNLQAAFSTGALAARGMIARLAVSTLAVANASVASQAVASASVASMEVTSASVASQAVANASVASQAVASALATRLSGPRSAPLTRPPTGRSPSGTQLVEQGLQRGPQF